LPMTGSSLYTVLPGTRGMAVSSTVMLLPTMAPVSVIVAPSPVSENTARCHDPGPADTGAPGRRGCGQIP
jgi:hypothetical protein